ncbi:MAG TPA: DUF4129 domain-containing protein [Saprospiraceae bacterium]|nr:DUF4129 domain-containing protein [Saprospiraceae bacterium]HND86933.1 DUF4129 domain-containing protein [Saprospiraceae bacterium]
MLRHLLFLILIGLWPTPPALYGQTEAQDEAPSEIYEETVQEAMPDDEASAVATPPPPVSPVPSRPVAAERWAKASEGLDYSDERTPEPPKPIEPVRQERPSGIDWGGIGQFGGNLLQGILMTLAVLGIGYGIYRMLQQPSNRSIERASDGVVITAANLDQYLHETDLQRFLRSALESGNYALAIRLYYLQIIKGLSERRLIAWSKEKTNRDYLRELRQHPQYEAFREATRTFERVWYGNSALQAEEYAALEPHFSRLLSNI